MLDATRAPKCRSRAVSDMGDTATELLVGASSCDVAGSSSAPLGMITCEPAW
jgi:hypothetical protein